MALFNGFTRGVLLVVFLTLSRFALAYDTNYTGPYEATNAGWDDDCVTPAGSSACSVSPPSHYIQVGYRTSDYVINNNDMTRHYYEYCSPKSNPNGTTNPDGSGVLFLVGINAPSSSHSNSVCFYDSSPPPEPECSIPAGEERQLSTPIAAGQVCYSECVFNGARKRICAYLNDGTSSCIATYTSTGTYCDDPDGGSARPFDDYKDENGCYVDTSAGKFCEAPPNDPCPNYTTIDGQKHCREPSDPPDSDGDGVPDNQDSDGDGIPDQNDPNPSNPDSDGDGLFDGKDPDPNNPDTDGDGVSDGQDSDANGNGVPDRDEEPGDSNTVGEGTCTTDTRQEPDCKSANPVECAMLLNAWHHRCDEEQFREELAGTEEYNEQGESLLNPDAPENAIQGNEVSFSTFADGLDDSGAGFGGSMSCPPDIPIDLGPIGSVAIPFTFICEWAAKIRPLVIALGWIAAGFIAFRSMTEK